MLYGIAAIIIPIVQRAEQGICAKTIQKRKNPSRVASGLSCNPRQDLPNKETTRKGSVGDLSSRVANRLPDLRTKDELPYRRPHDIGRFQWPVTDKVMLFPRLTLETRETPESPTTRWKPADTPDPTMDTLYKPFP